MAFVPELRSPVIGDQRVRRRAATFAAAVGCVV